MLDVDEVGERGARPAGDLGERQPGLEAGEQPTASAWWARADLVIGARVWHSVLGLGHGNTWGVGLPLDWALSVGPVWSA